MLSPACVLLLMHMIVILMLAMSSKFHTLLTYSISIVVRRILSSLDVDLSVFLMLLPARGSGRASSFSNSPLTWYENAGQSS